MHWSVVPFGKYKGKTFPQIICGIRTGSFEYCRNSTATSEKRRKSSRVEHESSNLHDEVGNVWKSHTNLTRNGDLMAFHLSTPIALLPVGQLDFYI